MIGTYIGNKLTKAYQAYMYILRNLTVLRQTVQAYVRVPAGKWHPRVPLLKVTHGHRNRQSDTDGSITCDFLLTFRSNHRKFSHRLFIYYPPRGSIGLKN